MKYNKGNYNEFFWVETHEITLGDLIKDLPELFLQKYLVNLFFDGSPKKIEFSDAIDEVTLGKLSTDNYDQWILIKEPVQVINATDYVNFTYFSLVDWEKEIDYLQDLDERNFIKQYQDDREKFKDQFWKEISEINPANFISDGSKLIFVSKDKTEVEKIIARFNKL